MNSTPPKKPVPSNESFIARLKNDPAHARLLVQEETILEVTEMIHEVMAGKCISRSELALKLGRSKGFVSQLLDGTANMTLRTLADVLFALDCRLSTKAHALSDLLPPRERPNQNHHIDESGDVKWCGELEIKKWLQPAAFSFASMESMAS